MKSALVDDDPRALAQLEQYLTEQLGRETEISHYGSGEALLADWRPGAFELVVLDIYMGGATGMEVARRLRAGDGQVRLAFATSSNDFASESYEVGACYYLRKPFRPEGVRAMLERLDLEALERSRRLRLPDGSQVVLRSICYASSDGHRVPLHCKDGDRTLRTSFAAVEPLLYRMLEVCVYSLTNFLPFLAMALYPFRRRLRFSPAEGLRRHAGVSGSVSGDAARCPAAAILRQCRRQCRTVLLCPAGGGPAGGLLREGPAAGVYRRR